MSGVKDLLTGLNKQAVSSTGSLEINKIHERAPPRSDHVAQFLSSWKNRPNGILLGHNISTVWGSVNPTLMQ